MLVVILFFSVVIYAILQIVKDKSKKIIITEQGIEDRLTNPSVGLISWCHVDDIHIVKIARSKMLAIYVYNPDEYLEKVPLNKRRGLKNNQRLIGTPFVVPIFQLNTNTKKLLDSIDLALEDWIATNQQNKI